MRDIKQTPVTDVPCEQLVVGTLLNYQNEWFNNADILSAELFSDWKCRLTFQAEQAVMDRGMVNPDIATIFEEVTKHPESYKNLTLPDIMELSYKVDVTADLRYKILRLQELMMRRQLRPIWQRLQEAEQEESIPLAKAQEEAMSKLQDLLTTSSTNIKTVGEVGKDFLVNVIEANRNGTREKGIVTGFKSLDERGAFQLSDMWVIAANSSQGKTSFALATILQAAKMMPEEERKAFLSAICEFGFYHQEPDFKSDYNLAKLAWLMIKPFLESQWQHSINSSKGGAPIGSHNNKNGRRGNVSKVFHQQKDSDNTDSKMPDIEARKEAFKNAITPELIAELEE